MRYKKEVFKIHSYKAVFSFGILLKMKKLTWFASHSVREFCGPIFHAFVFFLLLLLLHLLEYIMFELSCVLN